MYFHKIILITILRKKFRWEFINIDISRFIDLTRFGIFYIMINVRSYEYYWKYHICSFECSYTLNVKR